MTLLRPILIGCLLLLYALPVAYSQTLLAQPPVPTYYFPGTSKRHALIISGVHGTEAGGVEVVQLLLERLRRFDAPKPYFSLIVVPVLFPDNLAANLRATPGQADPNRQLPPVGQDPRRSAGRNCYLDAEDRCMEAANVYLLELIARYRPERIASIHGQRNTDTTLEGLALMRTNGGPSITTDPRPGHVADDEALALRMACYADSLGARVPANFLYTPQQTVRYPLATAIRMSNGITLGQWASRPTPTRPACQVITVETFGYASSSEACDLWRRLELEALARTLEEVFLKR